MNIKNRSDLASFPDGGRATRVRRYIPTLTRREFDLLSSCPYEDPGRLMEAGTRRDALVMAKAGLLEEDPTNRGWFRVTTEGAQVVERWRAAGWGDYQR